MITVVLDTQIILRGASSVTSSITAKIYAAWNAGRFRLLLSEPILAVAGGADYIVSADADVLSLGTVEDIPIVDAPAFWVALMREAVP